MADLSPSAITRKARTKGGLVTILTVLALVAGIGATWFGISVNDHVAANYDASAWLWSNVQGELARVNGLTGKTDTRQAVPTSKGHPIELSQSDRYLILRDLSTGKVSSFDPATLSITSTMDTQQGVGITIALHNDSAFIVDATQGVVRQLDPTTLQPIGETLRFPPGITGGSFDGMGRLWVAVPSEGTVTSITPAPLSNRDRQGGQGGSATPTLTRTEAVATPWHDLSLSALDNGVAVLDQTNGKLVAVRDDKVTTVTTDAAGGELPSRTDGAMVPVTVIEGRHIYVIDGDQNEPRVTSFTVPGNGKLQPAVAWAGRLYIADDTNGVVYSLDRQGQLVNTIKFKVPGPLQLEVREDHLFINSPGSNTAHVINDKHEDKEVDKFLNEIVGGDPPVIPPAPPQEPVLTKPGAPKNIKAAAGDNQVTLTWGKAPDGGMRITKYVVTGNGQTFEVGANQRSLVITGLINGTEYVFGVSAVNAKGQGPEGKSNKVIPTRDVPDPPTDVTAKANPNGTVEVSWTAANGQGRKIARYEVTAVSAGAAAPVGVAQGDATKLVIPDKELDYGKQYAFSIVTINDIGGGSKASTPLSKSVVPFNKPSAVKGLAGRTVAGSQGTVQFVWSAAEENGRPITGYEVVAGGKTQTVTGTSASIGGFGDGQIITGTVVAINEAGKGPTATATAKTISPPSVSGVRTGSVGYNSMVVHFAYGDGAGTATCTLVINGAGRNIPCSSGAGGYTVGGLWPGNGYTYHVSVANAAGTANSGNVRADTPELNGKVNCDNTNQYGDPTYCNGGIGVYVNSRQQSGEAVGDARDEQRYRAFCKKQGTAGNQSGDATLRSVAYNQNKVSSWWVQITFGGNQRYIPWIWFNMDGGDNLDMLPTC